MLHTQAGLSVGSAGDLIMPFCPSCRLEYRPGFSVCPDCNKQLVDHLPDPPPEKPSPPDYTQDWVPVAQFATEAYATMIDEGFGSLDIPVLKLSGTGHFGQLGLMGTSPLPVEGAYIILVPRRFVVKAHTEGLAMLGEVWEKSSLRFAED